MKVNLIKINVGSINARKRRMCVKEKVDQPNGKRYNCNVNKR